MAKPLRPWLGVLLFLCQVWVVKSGEVPGEILLEASQPVTLQGTFANPRTGLPDLDAFLQQQEGLITDYALPQAVDRHTYLGCYLLLRVSDAQAHKVQDLILNLEKLSSVRWAQPHHNLQANYSPNDPLFNQQWGLARIAATAAWDETRGSAAIPIAIIDTGCEMDHPDLVASLWSNLGEDANNDDVLDSSDYNGFDDDGNGFIDDFHGWDFVDAPTFPSSGDYLVRDNDPSDENGHGTAIAGICGAVQDNGIGVTGLAPLCPLMVLRAGNVNGYLQEDDVASALLYALDNGARVVNMSFGDTQASPMLEDVINYAAEGGLLMVASSGNFGNTTVIYPAAFGSILCVGACNQNNMRWSQSSYGSALDLLAPGTDIFTTLMDGQYGELGSGNGTSFSCAFASAAAVLVLSEHPNWTPAMVISTLKSSADDLPPAGWDMQTGQGILRADRAVETIEALTAEITSPEMQQSFVTAESLLVRGTAAGVYLQSYKLFFGAGESPSAWTQFWESTGQQVVDDYLGYLQIYEPEDSAYTIRLEVEDIYGNLTDDRAVIYFDPSAPVISNLSMVPILDGDHPAYLLRFNTDDITTGKVWLRLTNVPFTRWISQSLNYETTDHTLLIGENLGSNRYEYYLWVRNASGLTTNTDVLDTLDLTVSSVATNNFVEQAPCGIPQAHFYEQATDLDQDSLLEVWGDSLGFLGSKDSLFLWEAPPSPNWIFNRQPWTYGKEIPKSIGDSDADSLPELLTLYGMRTKLFEAQTPHGFPPPGNLIWSDSNSVWGVKLLDLFPNDGQGEVVLVVDGEYQLWRHTGSESVTPIQSLPNPFSNQASFMPPYCRVSDFDADGNPDILFGDYDGHLFMYEKATGASFTLSWIDSTGLLDTGEYLTDGDFDGDGQVEFAVAAHTQTVLAGEHLADTRYWALFVYKKAGDNQYVRIDTLYFFGAENPADFASGITSGNVYGGLEDEILLGVYPDFYVLQWDPVKSGLAVLWYYPEYRSNKAVVGDYDGNGRKEFLFNTGSSVKLFEAFGNSTWPPPPLNFTAIAPDTVRVILDWSLVGFAYEYNIYRGLSAESLGDTAYRIVSADTTAFTDFNVEKDTTYYYAISTTGSLPPVEGPKTVPQAATPNAQPFVVGNAAQFVPPNFVTIDFNEPMGPSLLNPNNYWVNGGMTQPNSVVVGAGGTRAVLTYDFTFADTAFVVDTTYRLLIYELYDLQGSPLSSLNDTLYFQVTPGMLELPYLQSASAHNLGRTINVVFSQVMDSLDILNSTFYSVTKELAPGQPVPGEILIEAVLPDTLQPNKVAHLLLDQNTPIGAFGVTYRITADTLIQNSSGQYLDALHNAVVLDFTAENLKSAFAFPNPYSSDSRVGGAGYITFAGLTPAAEIKIINLAGIVIKKLKVTSGAENAQWNLDNERGEKVGSGIYFYYISDDRESVWGKLAVVH